MKFSSSLLVLAFAASFLTPVSAEALRPPLRKDPITRPTPRAVKLGAREYRARMAAHRRGFVKNLKSIEAVRDTERNEYFRSEAPEYEVDRQGFVPFHTFRFRRSVRHFHWNTHFQELPDADLGQGHGADAEEEDEDENEEDEDGGGKVKARSK